MRKHKLILLMELPDGGWLAFRPAPGSKTIGRLAQWSESFYDNLSDPESDELTAGMTIAVPYDDFETIEHQYLSDLKPTVPGPPPRS